MQRATPKSGKFSYVVPPRDSVNPRICFNITFKINIRSLIHNVSLHYRIRAEFELHEGWIFRKRKGKELRIHG